MTDHSDNRRTVAVTGAGSGIGLAIAKAFAGAGDRLFLCDIDKDRVAAAVVALGPSATGSVVDVAEFEQVESFVNETVGAAGRLDVMVNNAGVADGKAGIEATGLELWHRVLDINLGGCFNGCKAVAPIMLAQKRGRILNMSSISAFRAGVNGVAYTAAKFGIVGLTQRLAVDLGPSGITVNALCPGSITTAVTANSQALLGDQYPAGMASQTSDEKLREIVPLGRRASPDEVAAAALFLASSAASYITGVALPIDGGWLLT